MDSRGEDSDAAVATCLVCGTKVALEAREREQASPYATVPCTGCSALVPVRLTDALHAAQDDIEAALADAAATRRPRLGRWRRS